MLLAVLILSISPLTFTGCDIVTASGETQTIEFDFTDFSRLEVSMGFSVVLSQADEYSVSLLIDKSLYEYLKIDQRGDTLYIGLKTNRTYTGSAARWQPLRCPICGGWSYRARYRR